MQLIRKKGKEDNEGRNKIKITKTRESKIYIKKIGGGKQVRKIVCKRKIKTKKKKIQDKTKTKDT